MDYLPRWPAKLSSMQPQSLAHRLGLLRYCDRPSPAFRGLLDIDPELQGARAKTCTRNLSCKGNELQDPFCRLAARRSSRSEPKQTRHSCVRLGETAKRSGDNIVDHCCPVKSRRESV